MVFLGSNTYGSDTRFAVLFCVVPDPEPSCQERLELWQLNCLKLMAVQFTEVYTQFTSFKFDQPNPSLLLACIFPFPVFWKMIICYVGVHQGYDVVDMCHVYVQMLVIPPGIQVICM